MASPLSGLFAAPEPKPSKMQGIGRMLAGFGAGVGGQGAQFIESIQAQDRALSQERTQAMIQDALAVDNLLANSDVETAMTLMNQRLNYIKQLGGDPTDTAEVMGLVAQGRVPEARQLIGGFLGQAESMGLVTLPKPVQPEIIPGSSIVDGQVTTRDAMGNVVAVPVQGFQQKAEPGFRILNAQEAQSAGLPADKQFQVNEANGQISQIGGSGTSVTTNVTSTPENAYIKDRASQQAAAMGDLEKAAEGAYRANRALDRFVEASAKGDAGAAQPFITDAKNLLASFGFDPEGLTDTTVMQQAIGDILGAKMAELGARGLTDRDMQILRDALPRVETSHEARTEVANIIRKANMETISEYSNQVQYEQENYPEYTFRRPSWYRDAQGMLQRSAEPASNQAPVGRFTIEVLP